MSLGYLDGKFIDKSQITISPLDYGFARGMTLFEFTRVYGGVPFRLDDHIQRFIHGAQEMGIHLSLSADAIAKAVTHIIAANKFAHSGIKFYLTMGECGKAGDYSFSTSSEFSPHLMMIEEEFKPLHPEAPRGLTLYQRGITLKIVPFARQISDVKSINYAAGFIASRQLAGTDFDEVLYQHHDGYITETTVSNFFCVIDGKLYTPQHTMLRGVTRIVILELAKKLNIPVVETDITAADLCRASESFITGSFLEMMPVRQIDEIKFTTMFDAPVFTQLRKALTAHINETCQARRT